MKDPYKTLGVPPDATAEDVKRAYHTKAKQTHRDAGGKDEEFRELNGAYLILRDPLKRKEYDETGNVNQKVKNEFSELANLLINAVGSNPEGVDAVRLMRQQLHQQIAKATQNEHEALQLASKFLRSSKKLKSKTKDDVLVGALKNQSDVFQQQADALRLHQEHLQKLTTMLDNYEMESDIMASAGAFRFTAFSGM